MSRSRRRRSGAAGWFAALLLLLSWAAAARGQDARRREAGVIGGGEESAASNTSEIDACAGQAADPDSVTRAREHYLRGSALYEQGDYENAIREFVAAYCHKPADGILIDIAQAFERLVNYEKSVAYLERFILEAPDDGTGKRERISYRVAVLRGLPARIRVATVPQGATVVLNGSSGLAARGEAGSAKPIEVRRGSYTMTVSLAGYQSVEQEVVAEIGQPYSFYFRLEPLRGNVRVFVSPSKARVLIDDRMIGVGSLVDTLPIGAHTLSAEAEGYQPAARNFDVAANRATDVRIELPANPRSGRRELIAASTVGGGLVGGSAIAGLFEQGSTAATIASFLGLGIGFGGAYLGIPDDISVGTSSSIIGGTLIASAEGGLVASLFACDSHKIVPEGGGDPSFNEECDADIITGVALASAVGGAAGTAFLAPRLEIDAGDAALINSGGMWGTAAGALFWTVFDSDPRIRSPLLLAGLNIGILSGAALAARVDVSRGHVALIDLSGLAGGIAGVAVASSFEGQERTERTPHLALGGIAIGLITGAYLTRNMEAPRGPLPRLTPTTTTTIDAAGKPTLLLGGGFTF